MRVLITGASSGIGAELARRLARRGDDLVLVARSRDGLEATAAAVRELGGTALVAPADVTDVHALQAAVDGGAAALGGLDAAVVNAGAAAYGLFADTPAADADRTVTVTLMGAINTVRAVLPHLERSSGVLVATGSVAARYPLPLMSAYTAAKHGLRGFMNTLRVELRATRSPVRLAMVHPGPVDTPFWTNVTPATVMPPPIPEQVAYDPEKVARALERAIDHPRRERFAGAFMRTAGIVPRPLRDAAFARIARWCLRHPGEDEPSPAIWQPAGSGERTVLAER
ncbi:MAG TPA: SDR family NAD(P)-dependent oxidoreductase [Solirubrobacteraceae bacterium]|nr:SDR family NAD(P)-dependent oxidoreductase [Solirubrobacteraceae bacterium]